MIALVLVSLAAGPPPAPATRPVVVVRQQPVPGGGITYQTPPPPPTPPPLVVWPQSPPVATLPAFDPITFQRACPGNVLQAFQRQPRVTAVGPCQTDAAVTGTPGDQWVYDFDEAAHILLPRFHLDGKAVADTDGLVIYEGMRLTVYPESGTYDLAFTATVPGLLTVLRLQLDFLALPPGGVAKSYKLTLPPIRLEPAAESSRGNTDADTFHVHHRGQSPIFWLHSGSNRVDAGSPRPVVTRDQWAVRRTGTARFGTPVAVDDANR